MMRSLLFPLLVGLCTIARAEDVVLEDDRRINVDREMVHVLNADTRVGVFVVHLIDGSKMIDSVGLTGCLSEQGMLAHGPPTDPSQRVNWAANGEHPFDFVGRIMCDQKTSGAKYAELLRQRQQLLPPPV